MFYPWKLVYKDRKYFLIIVRSPQTTGHHRRRHDNTQNRKTITTCIHDIIFRLTFGCELLQAGAMLSHDVICTRQRCSQEPFNSWPIKCVSSCLLGLCESWPIFVTFCTKTSLENAHFPTNNSVKHSVLLFQQFSDNILFINHRLHISFYVFYSNWTDITSNITNLVKFYNTSLFLALILKFQLLKTWQWYGILKELLTFMHHNIVTFECVDVLGNIDTLITKTTLIS